MKILIRVTLIVVVVVGLFKWQGWRGWLDKANAPQLTANAPQLTREHSNSLVFVEGRSGKGSGFICNFAGKKFVVTNQHVVAGNPGTKFTLLDQSPIQTGQASAAVGHDIMTFALLSDAKAMEMMTDVERNAAIGDDVAVLGNSDGDRVIKPLPGKLLGIGPDRVEVSAEFVHGNSGSPIIHIRSGKVIGIATFATVRKADSITGRPKDQPEVKRFGYRLDTVKQWQPVAWPEYTAEFQLLEKVETRTRDFVKFLLTGRLSAMEYGDPAIRNPLERFANAARGQGLIKTDRLSAKKELIDSLRTASETDIFQTQSQLKYDYFRRKLEEHQKLRGELHKGFDEALKKLPMGSQ